MSTNDVVITGIGLVSSLGEGADAHWRALSSPGVEPVVNATSFPPYSVHPLPEIDWNLQIPKRSDQRQMELWQRLGTYTAGLALDDAGIKSDKDLMSRTDMIISAGGGERDESVDETILAASETRPDHDMLLNEKLTTDLRPTLFLAQLSNLLAGNISIVHNVTGSSRTFMGEDAAGISALSTAVARIASGQSKITLVGGAFQATYRSMIMGYALGGHLHQDAFAPVWSRSDAKGGGIVPGSGGAFLVLESAEHAKARGARIYGRLATIVAARARRNADDLAASLGKLLDRAAPADGETLVVSAGSGAKLAIEAERKALDARPSLRPRGMATAIGHLQEAQFPFAVALAAMAVERSAAYPALDASEPSFAGAPKAALASMIGYNSGEGVALVTRAD
ncbi:beta-ketoacyl-ACP synthase [Arvimicrobium flavum]|uniref:beta-ketoacyl-ACP synthase n=1 Tax=Arvimicrobium flavum TaxID=3393320 RepID=UPI00237AE83A|nr:beta-ketoacyl-ACP synthase [Mesorhizobium shangrilense]